MEAIYALTEVQPQVVLDHLEVDPKNEPHLSFLEELIAAYTRHVPWESASRIVKRARISNDAMCPRWPNEFWKDAIEKGRGGTCFESNYAFYALLRKLGFVGFLTINNIGDSIGCHTAIVVQIEKDIWLADVGLPVYVPLLLHPLNKTRHTSRFHTYFATPKSHDVYEIDRDRHPKPNCYTLISTPMADDEFRKAIVADYGQDGHFLDRVIITKAIGDHVWRFNSGEYPYRIERFKDGLKSVLDLPQDLMGAAQFVSKYFGIDDEIVYSGLEISTAK